ELGDQVDVTAASAGLSAAIRRVVGIVEEYRGEEAMFEQRVVFGAPEFDGERGHLGWPEPLPGENPWRRKEPGPWRR
ncbi:MAG: hypothetical protein M1358_15730, partial [Chloroflexi bacterium]|nr:hypothetical protein [Chloroflexota bacterium]